MGLPLDPDKLLTDAAARFSAWAKARCKRC
jgi:hypothetical protein